MRIDAHQHFWQVGTPLYPWPTPDLAAIYRDFGPEHLVPLLTERNIAATVLVQAAPNVGETRRMLEIAAATPFVRGVVGWVDMLAPDIAAQLSTLAGNRWLKGIRPMLQGIADPSWILQPALDPAFEALLRLGLRFDALILPHHLPAIARVLDRWPTLPVVVDHGAKPAIRDGLGSLDEWAAGMRALAARPQCYCKLSGLLTEAAAGADQDTLRPYVDVLLAAFGPDRLMWGSDWPVVDLAGGYDHWGRVTDALLAGCNEQARTAILGQTAQRFYGL